MYLRLSTVHRGDRTYRYAQLVVSERRADGTPTNRVVASLGALSDAAIAGVRAALAASREGKVLVLPSHADEVPERARALGNFRYLDLAVLLHIWRETGLSRLVEELTASATRDVSVEGSVAALVLHRCVAPGSKLSATRWYGTTALPEIQGVIPNQFNNTRIHRALAAVDAAESAIQERLASVVTASEGAFTSLFIDATDTWFVGQGPPLAHKGLDKEGIYRRRIGLVLLCDKRGFPLRWHTLSGRYHDPTALAEMAEEAAKLPWAQGLPVVTDRALGGAGWTAKLHDLKVSHLTAIPATEFESCGAPIPWNAIDDLQSDGLTVEQIAEQALAAGFVRQRDDRYLLDLGLFDKARAADEARISQAKLLVRTIESIEANPGLSSTEMAEKLGISPRHLRRYRKFLTLGPTVRQCLLAGQADALGELQLYAVAEAPVDRQAKVLDALIEVAPVRRMRSRRSRTNASLTYRAHAVLTLNPARLVEDRKQDEVNLQHLIALTSEVNRRLATPTSRRTDASALAEIERIVKRYALGCVCTTHMHVADGVRRVVLKRNDAAWARRRRGDGLNLIVASPDIPGTGQEIVALYFAWDAVEKDFQTIKSFIKLRPIRHRTDLKLRAHVTICVLALLLQRMLAARLDAARLETTPEKPTPQKVFELLEPVRLNLLEHGGTSYYTVTQPGTQVSEILRVLGLENLVDDAKVGQEIQPR